MNEKKENHQLTGLEIAVIGMAGRFPGAANIKEFWENLINGVESIVFLTDEELKKSGVEADVLENPNYVKAGGYVEDKTRFDASFFGYSPREAELMVPQMRVLHECVWNALEDAGYVPDSYEGKIGLYAGASASSYWEALVTLSGKSSSVGAFAALTYISKDQLNMRISYNLNLKGPAVIIQTACSTALVSIHLACQGLFSGDCEMALAGGATLYPRGKVGYLYEEGSIFSPDGHCRPFDSGANGTVAAEGVGIVVLKSLEAAAADHDNIYALIKGSAINNDGRAKIGYSAPSARGQASVLYDAYQVAEVDPATVTYIEAHGTGTTIGDPIEIEALKSVFGSGKEKFCRIGSVKSNFGHSIDAAGVAGFIKTVLALKHRLIPPSIHINSPNPKIYLENSPFYLNTVLSPWDAKGHLLRAGVSAFAIGGTNAHVVLEEAPPGCDSESSAPTPPQEVLLFSAKTGSALDKLLENFAAYLKENPGINLTDAAYTLKVGRKSFRHRGMLVCSSIGEAIDALASENPENLYTFLPVDVNRPVVFLFSGQGSQYVNMGLDLYRTEPLFREEMDRCFEILKPLMGYDIKEIFYPHSDCRGGSPCPPQDFFESPGQGDLEMGAPKGRGVSLDINQTGIAQPVLFVFEYALAKLLMHWGISPYAMIGNSIGEYCAAYLSGVFSLEDALEIVALRGKLMQEMPGGSMLSVSLPETALKPLLNESLSLAVVGGASLCTVAGPDDVVDEFCKRLAALGHRFKKLHTSHAFHSKQMEPILERFEQKLKNVTLNPPGIPYISNLTGNWITGSEAADPAYWSQHLRRTVRFFDGLTELIKLENAVFVEIGPGRTLSALVRQHPDKRDDQTIIDTVRHPKENIPDDFFLSNTIGKLWLFGLDIHWEKFYASKTRKRISLPTYPFEGDYFDIDADISTLGKKTEDILKDRQVDIGDWMYMPLWEQSFLPGTQFIEPAGKLNWLVLIDECDLGTGLMKLLEQSARDIIFVRAGDQFQKLDDRQFIINPKIEKDYEELFEELRRLGKFPGKIIHMWGVTENQKGIDLSGLNMSQDVGLYCLLHIARVIGKLNIISELEIDVITNNLHEVTGEETFLCPGKATVLGAVKVIPLEYKNIKCRAIDIVIPEQEKARQRLVETLERELAQEPRDIVVAYRGNYRWTQDIKSLHLERNGGGSRWLRDKGVYLITGGLGGMGLTFAEHLAKEVKARLILVGRSNFPAKGEWDKWTAEHPENNIICRNIRKIKEIEKMGAEVMVFCADVSDLQEMNRVIACSRERFGPINGILHTAGIIDSAGIIHDRTREDTEAVLAAKVKGTLVLEHIFKDADLDFQVLFSSGSTLGYQVKYGQVGYVAANEFLDVFTYYKRLQGGLFTVTINWTDWKQVGMSVHTYANKMAREGEELDSQAIIEEHSRNIEGMMPEDAVEAFYRIMDHHLPRVFVAPYDLPALIEHMKTHGAPISFFEKSGQKQRKSYNRDQLTTKYIAPRDALEKKIAAVWEDIFGIDGIGVHDNFFELGGDSLLAAAFSNRFKDIMDEMVHVTLVFEAQTISGLGQYFNENYPKGVAKMIGETNTAKKGLEIVEKKEYYELTFNQERLWILNQREPNNSAYNILNQIELNHDVGEELLGKVLNKIAERHESIRTGFRRVKDDLFQIIVDKVEIPVKKIDLASLSLSEKEKQEKRKQVYIEEVNAPFDLTLIPLFRSVLIKLDEGHYELIFNMHHIISDGWSMNILREEFFRLYDAWEKKMPCDMEPLAVQYKDYAAWQNQMLADENKMGKAKEFWKGYLNAAHPVLNLPYDFPPGPLTGRKSSGYYLVIPAETTDRLRQVAREQKGSLFMVLLASFHILLSHITGQEDILMAIPAAGRHHHSLKNIVGLFVNTLVLQYQVKREDTFIDFLQEIRTSTFKMLEYQDYPLELVLDELKMKYPKISVFLNMVNIGDHQEILLEDQKSYHSEEVKESMFDIHCYLDEYKNGIKVSCHYFRELFIPETIEKIMSLFTRLLENISKTPDKKVKEYCITKKNKNILRPFKGGLRNKEEKTDRGLELRQDVKEVRQRLSKVNIDFLDYVGKNPGCFDQSNFKLLELNDDLFKLQPWPTFINRKNKAQFREAGIKLFNLIKQIPGKVFNYDLEKMGEYYESPKEVIALQMDGVTEEHIDNLVSRGDFLLSSTGLKCLEYNVSPNLGGWQIPIWESLYLNVPIWKRFFKEYGVKIKNKNLIVLLLEHFAQYSLGKLSRNESELNIALVLKGFKEEVDEDKQPQSISIYFKRLYPEILKRLNNALKGELFLCDYSDLKLMNGCIFYKRKKIHGVTETYNGLVSPEVMKAFKAGTISLFNGPIGWLLSNKLNLALLSDPETNAVFTDEEREIIDAYVPWTRKTRPGITTYKGETIDDLEYFMLSHQEGLVIKPAGEYGGKGIRVGKKTPQDQWQECVKNALSEKTWVVQELVESSPGVYLVDNKYRYHDMAWGFFIFDSQYKGAWVRVMPQEKSKGVINCHLGATVSVIFEVDE
jgi:acyl transferase domain-containing protein/NADP-dependent 3-hydroxy acid dehydrogenase YdfG